MKKYFLLCLSLLMLLSCNIFNPSGEGKSAEELEDKYGVEAVILEGKKYMWEENWMEAAKYFHSAVNMDSSKSEAWFYLGKSILRIYDVDLTNIWDEVNFGEGGDSTIPFLYEPKDENVKLTDSLTTEYSSNIVEVDFISDTTIDSIFFNNDIGGLDTIFDITSQIKFIPRNDVARTLIDSVFLDRKRVYDGMQHSMQMLEIIHTRTDMDGKISREQYEPDYFVATTVIAVLGMIDADTSKKLEWEPRPGEVNEREAFRILCEAITNIDNIEFDGFKEISTDPKGINGKIDIVLNTFLKADESGENFKDDIEDGMTKGANVDTSMVTNITDNFDALTSLLSTFYYDDFVDNDSDYYDMVDDTKQNRMIWIDWDHDGRIDINSPSGEHIHVGDPDHISQNPNYYEFISLDHKDSSTHISDSIARFRYKGGYNYEFLGGDWGIDEEIMDGEDNDGDGIADEDTRVVGDTLDDDGDWVGNYWTTSYDSLPMVVNAVTGLIIDITGKFRNVPIWQNYIIRHYDAFNDLGITFPDSLPMYDDSINGFNGDYISGDYGMDEEFYDGIDNDGDGLTDEDVGEYLPDESLRDTIISLLIAKGLR